MTWILNGKNPDTAPPTYDFSTTTIPIYVKPCGNCGQRNCLDCGTYQLEPPAAPRQVKDIILPSADTSRLPQPRVCLPEVEEQMAAHLSGLLEQERALEFEYDRGHFDGFEAGDKEGYQRGYQEGYAAARAEYHGY